MLWNIVFAYISLLVIVYSLASIYIMVLPLNIYVKAINSILCPAIVVIGIHFARWCCDKAFDA